MNYEQTKESPEKKGVPFAFLGSGFSTAKLCIMAVCIALCIVFERTVYIPVGDTSRYSLTFIMIYITGFMLGGMGCAIVAGIADVIGAFILYGSANPLITLCVVIGAAFVGTVIYQKAGVVKIVICALFNQLVVSLLLKTAALSILYYGGMSAYPKVFVTRLVQVGIMLPIEIAVMIVIDKMILSRFSSLVRSL